MLAAVAAVTFWGAWFPLSKVSVTDAITPADLALLRAGVPALVLLPVAMRHGLKAGRAGWWGTAALTGTIGVPFCLTLGTALEMAPAGHAAILIPGVFPALIVLLGALLLGERVGSCRLAGLAFAVLGVCMVGIAVLPDAPGAVLPAYGLMHLAAWMWAVYTVAVRLADIPALHALAIANVASTALFLPFLLLLGGEQASGDRDCRTGPADSHPRHCRRAGVGAALQPCRPCAGRLPCRRFRCGRPPARGAVRGPDFGRDLGTARMGRTCLGDRGDCRDAIPYGASPLTVVRRAPHHATADRARFGWRE